MEKAPALPKENCDGCHEKFVIPDGELKPYRDYCILCSHCKSIFHQGCAKMEITKHNKKGRDMWFCSQKCDKEFPYMRSPGTPCSSCDSEHEYGEMEMDEEMMKEIYGNENDEKPGLNGVEEE